MTGHKAWLMLAAPLCCVFVFCTVSIRITNNLISLDPLIQMNNRGQLQRYIDQDSNLYREGLKTYVIMIDVNDFKSIDDTFGHAEGDRAFIRLS
ncbi:MAG: diguanylate cyclase [Bacillota bacterium]|nr:diguanylate cyclase [Bacillota bacterium]